MSRKSDTQDFADEASKPQHGVVGEMFDVIVDNKKWSLVPIVVALSLVVLIILCGTSAAPFTNTLF